MRVLETDEIKPTTESSTEEKTLSWKSVLSHSLGKSENQLHNERAWANLCQSMRDLCPETNWVSIYEQSEQNDQRIIKSIQVWLESLVITADWPFPEQVILMSAGDINSTFRIIFNKNITKLPYTVPPKGISVSPCRDEHTTGWKIFPIQINNHQQIGQA